MLSLGLPRRGVYEIWVSRDGSEVSMFPADHPEDMRERILTQDADGRRMRLKASFWADSWDEAKAARDAIMGWS